jgi:hypothetical protein
LYFTNPNRTLEVSKRRRERRRPGGIPASVKADTKDVSVSDPTMRGSERPVATLTRLISAAEVSEILGIAPETVRLLARLSTDDPAYLPAVRIGTGATRPRVLFHPDDVRSYIEARRGLDAPA